MTFVANPNFPLNTISISFTLGKDTLNPELALKVMHVMENNFKTGFFLLRFLAARVCYLHLSVYGAGMKREKTLMGVPRTMFLILCGLFLGLLFSYLLQPFTTTSVDTGISTRSNTCRS